MKYLLPLFFSATTVSVFLLNFNFIKISTLKMEDIPVCDCIIDLGDDITLELGDSVQLEGVISCQANQIESISWSESESLSCADCLNPTALPLENTCYEVTITWTDGCISTEEICISIKDCGTEFTDNEINQITPAEISDMAEIELEIAKTQFVSIDIVDGDEILYSIWEGWLTKGLQNINLDFSTVPTGNYELRARLYPENKTINIQKL